MSKQKEMTLGDIGFAMKYEATMSEETYICVDKKLWLEIAQVLMDTDENLKEMHKIVDDILKNQDKRKRKRKRRKNNGIQMRKERRRM